MPVKLKNFLIIICFESFNPIPMHPEYGFSEENHIVNLAETE